jgi:hypothetical protein
MSFKTFATITTHKLSRRPYRGIFLFLFLSFSSLLFPFAGEAVSRGAVVDQVIRSLGLPSWKGASRFSDVAPSHPYAQAIETASALGILLPGSHFHPDIEATRAEALGFAFWAMGWRKEGQIVQALAKENLSSHLPAHLGAFVHIASEINVPPPPLFLQDPAGDCSSQDLTSLGEWLRACRRSRLIWEASFPGSSGTLLVHRENIGYPPSSWGVQVLGMISEEEAESLATKLKKQGMKVSMISEGFGYTLKIGPYKHYYQAWLALLRLSLQYSPTIVPFSGGAGGALFWCAIKGSPQELMPEIRFASPLGEPKLPLSRIAEATRAEGGINGGYFTGSTPIGTLYHEGLPLSEAYKDRSALGWNSKGEVFFGSGAFKSYLQNPRGLLQINHINSPSDKEGIELVTPHLGIWKRVTRGGLISQFRQGILAWRTYGSGIHPVPPEGFLCIARGKGEPLMRELELSSPGEVVLQWEAPEMQRMEGVIQGGPMLFKDGQPWGRNEGFAANFTAAKHPRTLVGFDGKDLWWIVIDGRNSWHSLGVSLTEAQRIAYALGLKSALNLDGGGSSTLWWQGIIVNVPSEGKERFLPYGVLFGVPE